MLLCSTYCVTVCKRSIILLYALAAWQKYDAPTFLSLLFSNWIGLTNDHGGGQHFIWVGYYHTRPPLRTAPEFTIVSSLIWLLSIFLNLISDNSIFARGTSVPTDQTSWNSVEAKGRVNNVNNKSVLPCTQLNLDTDVTIMSFRRKLSGIVILQVEMKKTNVAHFIATDTMVVITWTCLARLKEGHYTVDVGAWDKAWQLSLMNLML